MSGVAYERRLHISGSLDGFHQLTAFGVVPKSPAAISPNPSLRLQPLPQPPG